MKITAYDFGRIDVEGNTYTSDVIITPDKVTAGWWRKEGHRLHVEDLKQVVGAKPDILIVGTGYYGRMAVPVETQSYLESMGIELRQAKTSQAVEEFNTLQQRYARIVAAFHLTC